MLGTLQILLHSLYKLVCYQLQKSSKHILQNHDNCILHLIFPGSTKALHSHILMGIRTVFANQIKG